MLQLANDRLLVEIAAPGTIYRGSRFDRSTFVTQVTLDGRHTFCAPESREKGVGSGGIGLCNEFGLFQPLFYDSAKPGEPFPKLGVGLLRRLDDGPYDFTRSYPVESFPLTVTEEEGGGAIHFQFEPLPCHGCETRLKKTARLLGNCLRVEYELENVGTKFIATEEYNHNFLCINGAHPGPGYSLDLAHGLSLDDTPYFLRQDLHRINWTLTPQQPHLCRTANHLGHESPGEVWELRHASSGASVSETVNSPISRFALWNAPHAVSPEVFLSVEVAPGETRKWAREFRFSTL